MPGFQSTQLVTEGTLEPFFFLYADDSIQGNPETCKQSSIMLNYEVKNNIVPNWNVNIIIILILSVVPYWIIQKKIYIQIKIVLSLIHKDSAGRQF